ncbi:MAG: hypothetical protein AUF79_16125 [Crenarchaeota archaeon 13_1_20CM_2_51_8]|nr:MAG: hypothetical protein AUF79_16125 [Crenarchaeota archaeon 13_1_20CM_2_51_8]
MSKGPIAVILAIIIIGAVAGYLFYTDYVEGTLVLSITDPALAPPGNSQQYDPSIVHIYATVSQFQVHIVGQGNASGWKTVTVARQNIDLMTVLSTSKILGSVKLSTGEYDSLRFNITNITVNFSTGASATYNIPSGSLKVTIMNGGFQITPTSSVAVQVTLSFKNNEILAMNGHLAPVATGKVVA